MPVNFDFIPILMLILVQVGLGVYVLLKTSRNHGTVAFACFCFSLSLWAFSAYFLGKAANLQEVNVWGKLIFVGPVFTAYFFLVFSFVFPAGTLNNIQRFLVVILPIIFLLLIPTPMILKEGFITATGPEPIWGKAYPLFMIYFLSYFGWGVFNLMRKYIVAKSDEKNQIRYVFTGLFLAFVFGIIFNLLLPALGVGRFLTFGPYFTLLIIGFTAFAIVKHRLMDISVVISRFAAEIMAIITHGIIYLTLSLTYQCFSKKIDPPFLTMTIAYGIIVGQTHHRLRLFFQTTTDKLFLRGKYNYYKTLAEASSRVGKELSLEHILQVLYDTFTNVMELASPKIFLPEEFAGDGMSASRYVVYDPKTCKPLPDGEALDQEAPLLKTLIAGRAPIQDGKEMPAELLIPCLVENRLIGFFMLGKKLSEDTYTEDDLRLLEALANQSAIALDHTRSYEKIKQDLEVAQVQVERSQRLASLGTLTAGVTHEIRNPLTVIRAETERLNNQPRDAEYLKNYQALLLKHITRIEKIVQRMLGMAKQKARREEPVSLNGQIENVLPLIHFKNVSIKKELAEIPKITGDPDEIQEVFINLFQNAAEAMPEGGALTVSSRTEEGKIIVEISDTGKGIPPEIQEKIFDPSFSTRHEGVGLGLPIVFRIVHEHGGEVKVASSAVGVGTTFRITF